MSGALAYLLIDERGFVQEAGGSIEALGLSAVAVGEEAGERVDALHGLWPLQENGVDQIPRVELAPGCIADIHLSRRGAGALVLFREVTGEAEQERHYQQKGNELSLMLRSLGAAIFERLPDERFVRLGLPPLWLRTVCADEVEDLDLLERFPFLETFLDEAQEAWDSGRPAVSGIWVEEDASGREWYLEATALRIDEARPVLVLQNQESRYEERRQILQEARVKSLDFDRLRKEIDKKEVLLHCIIHDLKGPLSSMVGTMSLVQGRDLAAEQIRELLTVGLEQARHQEAMIKSILDTFSAEVNALQSFETTAELAPGVLACVTEARDTYAPAYAQNGVGLEIVEPGLDPERKVVGEHSRLVRVFCNLLENALRHSPKDGTVSLRVLLEEGGFRMSVEDQGRGVPEALRETLFQKFAQGKKRGGAAGLGLYFCRSTVEMWGGRIGYASGPEGGSCFWIALPEAL